MRRLSPAAITLSMIDSLSKKLFKFIYRRI